MANESHLEVLRQGVEVWNAWREQDGFEVRPDLSKADLSKADLSEADLSRADLSEADLSEAKLKRASLREADLFRAKLLLAELYSADLKGANLQAADLDSADLSAAKLSNADLKGAFLAGATLLETDLTRANLREADFFQANLMLARLHMADLKGANFEVTNLSYANLDEADLSEAKLYNTALVETMFRRATLTDCRIYGISAWNVDLEGAQQQNLNISKKGEPDVMVDNLEVAQFVYLLLNNQKVRQVIDTVTSKAVLILGRFTEERKAILDAIRDALRQRGYLPILFDFEKPASRDLTETISTLAHMAKFIIADITHAKSIPQELHALVPNLPSVPVQPLLLSSEREYGMFEHFRRYPWVLETYYYDTPNEILTSLEVKIIIPAEAKASELSR